MKKIVYGLFVISLVLMLYVGNVMADNAKLKLIPGNKKVEVGDSFTLELIVTTKKEKIGAYSFKVTSTEGVEITSVERGDDGVIAASNLKSPQKLNVNGFEVQGLGPGRLNLLTITAKAVGREGKLKSHEKVVVHVETLANELGKTLKSRKKVSAKVKVINKVQ